MAAKVLGTLCRVGEGLGFCNDTSRCWKSHLLFHPGSCTASPGGQNWCQGASLHMVQDQPIISSNSRVTIFTKAAWSFCYKYLSWQIDIETQKLHDSRERRERKRGERERDEREKETAPSPWCHRLEQIRKCRKRTKPDCICPSHRWTLETKISINEHLFLIQH